MGLRFDVLRVEILLEVLFGMLRVGLLFEVLRVEFVFEALFVTQSWQ